MSKVRLTLVVAMALAGLAARGAAQTVADVAGGAKVQAQGVPPSLPHGLESFPAREITAGGGTESRLPRPEALTTFDPDSLELSWKDGHWSLMAAGVVLKDFGRREEEQARQAWHLIRELRLNQRGTVGAPRPVLEYWLADGRPPPYLPRGVRVLPLDLAALRIEQVQGSWSVREPGRPLFNFGTHKEEAEQALAVLRKYGFNQVGVVGRATAAMLIFVARPVAEGEKSLNQAASDARFNRRGSFLKTSASTEEGRQQAEAIRTGHKDKGPAGRSTQPAPGPFPLVPAMPLLQPDARPRTGDAASVADVVTERVPFDWRQAQVRLDAGDWKLVVGSVTLGNFGRNERDARLAHAALVHYRFTEQQRVGAGAEPASVSYFLAGGQAPLGLMGGLFSEPFQPEMLSVRQVHQHFCVAWGNHPILDCGTRSDEARYMLGVIRQYRFDHVCRIGTDDKHSLTFLVRSR
jgi:hypothetical protein